MNSHQTKGKTLLSLMILSLLLIVGCFESTIDILRQEIDEPIVAPIDASVPLANTEFGFNLFNTIWETDQDQNIFISPFSISVALAMTLNGASGETEQAMIDTLQLQDVGTDSINSSYAQLLQALQTSDPKITLTIANSLWGRQGIPFRPDFLQRNTQFFNAEISTLDFLDPNTLTAINQWVNDNTNGKIPKILDEIDANAVLFLINAIYFKGIWQTKFDPVHTRDRTFHLTNSSTKQVPMMFRSGHYSHYRGDAFQAVNLPYGNGRISMYIFLPARDSNLNTFLETLNPENWENWMSQFREQELALSIPKFNLEYGTKELNDALIALGMGITFDPNRADFSRMVSSKDFRQNLYIDKVSHKTILEVNEEGTEAAAVTIIGIVKTSLPPEFTADRPFFFAIRDNETGTVLFMGTVVAP